MKNYKIYQNSDCILMNTCKRYYDSKKHVEIFDRFARFLCDQINGNTEHADKIIEALNKEALLIDNIFEHECCSKTFKYVYCNVKYCLSFIDGGDIESALTAFFTWHNVMCKI